MLPSQEHRASCICRGLITPRKERAAHPEPRGPAGSGFRLAGGGQVGVTYRGGGCQRVLGAHSVGLDQDPAPPASVLRGQSRGGWTEEIVRAALFPPDCVRASSQALLVKELLPSLRLSSRQGSERSHSLPRATWPCLIPGAWLGPPLPGACWTADTVPGAPARPPTRLSTKGDPL